MKNRITLCLFMFSVVIFSGCQNNVPAPNNTTEAISTAISSAQVTTAEVKSLINAEGDTVAARIMPPDHYQRVKQSKNSLAAFLRKQLVKADGSPVMLYDGSEKRNQSAHIAVFDMDVGTEDLQQCADSVIRLYAEYYWSIKDYDAICFHLVGGFLMDYNHWRDGMRLAINGNNISWKQKTGYDDSYSAFRSYLRMVFAYASTLSLEEESTPADINDLKVGDMFIKGGSPGHVVLVLDIAEDENGNRCFLLGQGYMPAQEFHVLKNPLHEEDPWYYLEELTDPIRTPEYSFSKDALKRFAEF